MLIRRKATRKRSRNQLGLKFEQLEKRQLLAADITELFRPFEFGFEGDFEGSATVEGSPDYVVEYSGETSGSGLIEYTNPTEGSGQLSGEASGPWSDNFGDAGTFEAVGSAEVNETDGTLAATQITGSGSSSSGLTGSINLTGLSPGDADAVIDLLANEATATWNLDIGALVGGPATTQGTADVELTPALTELTDLRAASAAFTSGGGVEFTVEATGQLVPTDSRASSVAEIEVFWASGPTLADQIQPASDDGVPVHWNTGEIRAELSELTAAPAEATHLLVVADPANELNEGDEQNNAFALPLVESGKITGGGTLEAGVRNFGFVVQTRLTDGTARFQGNLQYQDKAAGIRLHSTSIDTLQTNVDGSGTFSGEARVNGVSGYRFTVHVDDLAEPGRGNDTFHITIEGPDGFSYDSDDLASDDEVLKGGNIQVHPQKGKARR